MAPRGPFTPLASLPGPIALIRTLLTVATLFMSLPTGCHSSCASVISNTQLTSIWCTYPDPTFTTTLGGLYKGRMSVTEGPVITAKGSCGQALQGTSTYAAVMLSTKFMPASGPASTVCPLCICVKIRGVDLNLAKDRTTAQTSGQAQVGKIFRAKVYGVYVPGDDYHLRILMDRTFSFAPVQTNNPSAGTANAQPGPRLMSAFIAQATNVFIVEWTFVRSCTIDCNLYYAGNAAGRKLMGGMHGGMMNVTGL